MRILKPGLVDYMLPVRSVVAFTGSIFNGASLALLQAKIPPEIQARVLSLQLSAATAMAPLGLAVAGPVTDILGPQIWFLVAGIALTVGGLGGFFISPLMQIEDKSTEEVRSKLSIVAGNEL